MLQGSLEPGTYVLGQERSEEDRVGKNTSNELNIKPVISMEASQMLPIPVAMFFFGGRASFSTLIQMTSTINLCKPLVLTFSLPLLRFSSQRGGSFSHSIILGGGRGRWTALKTPYSKTYLFSLGFFLPLSHQLEQLEHINCVSELPFHLSREL